METVLVLVLPTMLLEIVAGPIAASYASQTSPVALKEGDATPMLVLLDLCWQKEELVMMLTTATAVFRKLSQVF